MQGARQSKALVLAFCCLYLFKWTTCIPPSVSMMFKIKLHCQTPSFSLFIFNLFFPLPTQLIRLHRLHSYTHPPFMHLHHFTQIYFPSHALSFMFGVFKFYFSIRTHDMATFAHSFMCWIISSTFFCFCCSILLYHGVSFHGFLFVENNIKEKGIMKCYWLLFSSFQVSTLKEHLKSFSYSMLHVTWQNLESFFYFCVMACCLHGCIHPLFHVLSLKFDFFNSILLHHGEPFYDFFLQPKQ